MRKLATSAAILLALTTAPAAVYAQAADPAGQVIDGFNQSLLSVMKDAKRLGANGRFQRLDPIIAQTFDLPAMTRFAVGTSWSTLSPAEQQNLVRAFGRMTTATYAHNFDNYNGQKFAVEKVETRGPDKLVQAQITKASGATTSIVYRMRQSGANWKVIDVYFNGTVSSLLGQRSEYAATLKNGGAPALVNKLDTQTSDLLAKS
jgi:phospholipid transport system substrate-binding protein